ncbi:uncharacterized protein [Aquarana catesbeiana]|uniref:uncharacterized protein n=1 Tax=Aquarana catesbeiana TaxID=8400 RepID=UPI003CC92CD6
MTTSMGMEEDRSHITERILNLTLEIIYLLIGESFPPVKSGDHMTITVPPCDSLKPERHNMQKILEVTKKMMELLTGEVPIRCQDVTVYFSMEEWEYLEGHKDLYKDVMMDNQPPLTSPDGSSNGNPPERCPRPLYSWDSTQEDHTIPHHHQSEDLSDSKLNIKEDIKKEENDEEWLMEESESLKGQEDLYQDNMVESSSYRNPPERCPRPLYSQDYTQEGHTIPYHHQGEDLMIIKVEGEVEETYVRDDQQYTEEAGMMRSFKEEDTPTEISTGHAIKEPSKYHLTFFTGCKMEDGDITRDFAGENATSSAMDGGLHSVAGPWNPFDSEQPCTVRDGARIQGEETFSCLECGESFSSELSLTVHQISHTDEKLHSCSDCGKCFLHEFEFIIHCRSHTGEKTNSCPECGKCFKRKSFLVRHQRSHTGEKPYSCPECRKCFLQKSHLVKHQRVHTGEKPYICPECGKCFKQKSNLFTHLRAHTREKMHPERAKCFTPKTSLVECQGLHTGEKQHPCPECGKGFTWKSNLLIHLRSHTGEKPYSCPECWNSYSRKSHLVRHQRSHTGERPFCCPECGNCYSRKSHLVRHQRSHRGV